MTRYSLLVTLHVASVVVWLGCGTTLAFVTIYAQRARNDVVLEQLGALTQWMALRVLAPASLAAASFGVAAAHVGHWQDIFFFHVGEAAFVFSFLLTVAIRLPLLRQARKGGVDAADLSQYLLAVALAELTVLYLAVAEMVAKPSGIGTSVVRYGGGLLALGLLAAAAIAYRARKLDPRDGRTRSGARPRPARSAAEEVRHLHQLERAGESEWTPWIAITSAAQKSPTSRRRRSAVSPRRRCKRAGARSMMWSGGSNCKAAATASRDIGRGRRRSVTRRTSRSTAASGFTTKRPSASSLARPTPVTSTSPDRTRRLPALSRVLERAR